MTLSASQALAACTLYTDEIVYTLVKLPAAAIWAGAGVIAEIGEPFGMVLADKDEVTLVIPLAAWEDYQPRLPGAQQQGEFRLITFDLELDLELIGFMALLAQTLAAANVPILALGAFSRDHILVPSDRFQPAWDALKHAQQ